MNYDNENRWTLIKNRVQAANESIGERKNYINYYKCNKIYKSLTGRRKGKAN